MLIGGPSVFRSDGERAAWLLLRAYLHDLEGDLEAVVECLYYAVDAVAGLCRCGHPRRHHQFRHRQWTRLPVAMSARAELQCVQCARLSFCPARGES